ncbi:MAG: hypothetical protein Q8P45_02585, partial [Candidatus Harrisonbacteria bacterium]|nr:hypothetical protein [Candidatus Harrisonbacteria bacterium]
MRRFTILIVILAAFGAGYYYRADLARWYQGVATKVTEEVSQLKKITRKIIAPPPLRGPTEDVASFL